MRRTLLTFALSLVISLPVSAQQLKLAFHDGRVSIDATGVPVRTILTEWGKLGGTKVIGGDRITGSPLTLKLEDVPESQALEIVLRSVAGYMAAPRSASAATGASIYDRILVMATSVPPPPPPRGAANQGAVPANQNQRFVPPRPTPQPAEEDDAEEEPDPNPPNAPVFSFPQPGQQGGFAQPGMFQPPGANGQPGGDPNSPQGITVNPTPYPGVAPFGSPQPGMITAPLKPGQPGTVVRPPGGDR
jgi:hypothetical protein